MTQFPSSLAKFPWSSLGRREPFLHFEKKLVEQKDRLQLFKHRPRISIVVPVLKSPDWKKFERTIDSLLFSAYPDWEGLLVFSSENDNEFGKKLIREKGDARLRYIESADLSVVALKQKGIELSTGEWVGILDPGDLLSPAALFHLALEIQKSPEIALFYTNEAFVHPSGKSIENFLTKSEFSWFNLIHRNYIGRFWIAGRSCFSVPFRPETGEWHEWDWLLRLCERDLRFKIVPFFHYYSERPISLRNPTEAQEPAIGMVQAHLERKKFAAKVKAGRAMGDVVTIVPPVESAPKVSAVICFRGKIDWTERSVRALLKQADTSLGLEIFLVDNGTEERELEALKASLKHVSLPLTWCSYPKAFNFADMHNEVFLKKAKGDYFLFLNNDVFWEGEHSLSEMVGWAQHDWVGTVGMVLRYPDGRLQHTGLRASYGGESRLVRIGNGAENPARYFATREVFGNSFASCLVRSDLFREIGGLRVEDLPNGFGDVAFNLECLRKGYHNLNLGYLTAVHVESGSRGMEYEYWEEFLIEREFPDLLQKMLRYDLGFNRTPESDFPLRSLLRQAVGRGVREYLPWLMPIRPLVRKWLRV